MLELKSIWNLVKTGFVRKTERSKKELMFFSLKMLLILVIFKIFSIGLVFLLGWLEVFDIPVNITSSKLKNFSDFEILLLTAVYAPIAEELTYRLPLKFSKRNVIISLMGLNLGILRIFGQIEYLYCFSISAVIGILLYLFLQPTRTKLLEDLWLKNKLLIFYFFLLVFSFLHLKNYEITTELLLFSPIIILPRILDAMVYSHLRLSSGVLLAICFHAFNNGIFKIVTLISNYANGLFS